MKKTSLLIVSLIVSAVFTSCSSFYNLAEQNTRLLPVASTAHTIPTVADLSVSSVKITHQVTVNNNFSLKELSNFGDSPQIVYYEKLAANEAAQKYDADVIVAPSYVITTSDDHKSLIITVSGYPATYTNFRPATPVDMEMIKNETESNMIVPCTSSQITDPNWRQKYTR